MSLAVPELATHLDRLRDPVLASKRRTFPRLPAEDLEDAYAQVVEDVLGKDLAFENETQLAGYLHRAVENRAKNITMSAAHRTRAVDVDTIDLPGNGPELDDQVAAKRAQLVLIEFIAEETFEQDRTIAYLALSPEHQLTARQIACALGIPTAGVQRSLKRIRSKLDRFSAHIVRPAAFCQRRRKDVLAWQQTGTVPLPLRVHLSHCHNCRARYRDATDAARHAILPLLPATALPATSAGALARIWNAAGAHRATQRLDDALGHWRKIAPVGGGGGAAIAAKLATAGAVVTIGAATAALHAITSTHAPHRVHHPARATIQPVAIHRLNLAATNSAPIRPITHVAALTSTTASANTKTTKTTVSIAPPPNYNPLPATRHATSGEEHAALATSAGSSSSQQSSSTAYAPPPNQNTSPTSSSHTTGSSTSSGVPAPGGPPAP